MLMLIITKRNILMNLFLMIQFSDYYKRTNLVIFLNSSSEDIFNCIPYKRSIRTLFEGFNEIYHDRIKYAKKDTQKK